MNFGLLFPRRRKFLTYTTPHRKQNLLSPGYPGWWIRPSARPDPKILTYGQGVPCLTFGAFATKDEVESPEEAEPPGC